MSNFKIKIDTKKLEKELNKQIDKMIKSTEKEKLIPQNNNEWYRYGRSQALDNCEVDQKIIVGILSQGYNHVLISPNSTNTIQEHRLQIVFSEF